MSEKRDSLCRCEHYQSQHMPLTLGGVEVDQGHGRCSVELCHCEQFRWARWASDAERLVQLLREDASTHPDDNYAEDIGTVEDHVVVASLDQGKPALTIYDPDDVAGWLEVIDADRVANPEADIWTALDSYYQSVGLAR